MTAARQVRLPRRGWSESTAEKVMALERLGGGEWLITGVIEDEVIGYVRHGRQYWRRYTRSRNPRSEAQSRHRDAFRDAVRAWREIPEDEKAAFRTEAAELVETGHSLTGFNLFVQRRFQAQPREPRAPRTRTND